MAVRPPRALRKPLPADPLSAALEHEVVAEPFLRQMKVPTAVRLRAGPRRSR